jgi:hypothetical protein
MTFTYRLQQADGAPAEPPTIRTAVPNMRPGDTIRTHVERLPWQHLSRQRLVDRRSVRRQAGPGVLSR